MQRLLNHLRSQAVAYVALFIALGGTGYAATRLPAGSVGTRALKNQAVTSVKLDGRSIAGYVTAYAEINAQGQLVTNRPSATMTVIRPGAQPGYLIRWDKKMSQSCVALATAELPASTTATAYLLGGAKSNALTYVWLSDAAPVNVAVICPS